MLLTLLTPINVLDAHLLLEMLFETSLVCEFPEAVCASQRSVLVSRMRRLAMVIEEAFLGEVLSAFLADEGTFASVHPVGTKQNN